MLRIYIHILFCACLLTACIPDIEQDKNQQAQNELNLIKQILDPEAVVPDWKSLATEIPFEEKKYFLLKLGRSTFYNESLHEGHGKTYASHFHFIDINEDGNLDIVYNSIDGADAEIFIVWLNENGEYVELVWEGGIISYFNLDKRHFILSHHRMETAYKRYSLFTLLDDKLIVSKQINFRYDCFFPDKISFTQAFKTIQTNYHLRAKPSIEDEPCEELGYQENYCGNQYKQLKKGTKGIAFAESTDETGRVWWLALVEEGEGAFALGWLSSRFVEEEEEG